MAGKLIKGILQAVDENLGTKILGPLAKKSLQSGGYKLLSKEKRGVFAPEPSPGSVHPDITLRTDTPLQRMFHASNSRVPFDRPTGGLIDEGLHVTPSPDLSDMFALHFDPATMGLAGRYPGTTLTSTGLARSPGPRVYPLLVDPGRTLEDFPIGPVMWNDPDQMAWMMRNQGFDYDNRDLLNMYDELNTGSTLKQAMHGLGWDSIKYPITSPYSGVEHPAYLLADPKRAVPEYSKVAQEAAKVRGVLAQLPTDPGATRDYTTTYAKNFGRYKIRDADHWLEEHIMPSRERIEQHMDDILHDINIGAVHPQDQAFLQDEFTKLLKLHPDPQAYLSKIGATP